MCVCLSVLGCVCVPVCVCSVGARWTALCAARERAPRNVAWRVVCLAVRHCGNTPTHAPQVYDALEEAATQLFRQASSAAERYLAHRCVCVVCVCVCVVVCFGLLAGEVWGCTGHLARVP
jgi:hypothetical protein